VDRTLSRSKTFHVVERVKARDRWKFIDAPLERRAVPAKNHCIRQTSRAISAENFAETGITTEMRCCGHNFVR